MRPASAHTSNLTQTQLLLWAGQQMHPDTPLYNMALAFRFPGSLDVNHFRRAFQALLDRSDALRTVIDERDGTPQQHVRRAYSYEVEHVDLSAEGDVESALQRWLQRRCRQPFDLAERLFDVVLITLGPEASLWYLNQHHLITDGWSAALVYRYLADFYERSRAGSLEAAPSLPAFADYAANERAFRASPRFRKAEDYWRERGPIVPIRLYGTATGGEGTRTERYTLDLGPDRSRRLRALAREPGQRALTEHMSLFNLFAAVLLAYLFRVSGQRRLALGTPSHRRSTAAFKETIGVFIEVFPYRIDLDEDETFASLLQKVHGETNVFLRYALPGISGAVVNRSYNILLNYINASFPPFDGLPVVSEWLHPGHGDREHHLRLQVHDFDEAGRFKLHFDFNADLFDEAAREAAAGHFLHLLDAFIADPSQRLSGPSLLSTDEEQRLIDSLNAPCPSASTGETVIERFEYWAAMTPEAVAVQVGSVRCTYRQLNTRVNRLAHYLRRRGVGTKDLVGLHLPRSLDAVVGMLAILKAGGAYVPLDPAYPAARLALMLDDAQPVLILTRADLRALPVSEDRLVAVDREADAIAQENENNPSGGPKLAQTAYVLYTSGSTGHPKGVVVGHGALAQYVDWARAYYLSEQAQAFALFTPLAFDLTVTSIFVPLTAGGRIVVYGEEAAGIDLAVRRVFEENEVDVVKLTPSHLALISDLDLRASRVQKLILGGEDLKTALAASIYDSFGGDVAVYNEYGPTEATVGCMIHRYDPAQDRGVSVPIGHPAAQARIYVLDEALHPVPPGVPGEIYVGGTGLADGYLHHPELTASRFVPDPFSQVPGARMYRTGDAGRLLEHGTVQYLGRLDQQVKIRGARIEIGEVEAAMQSHPAIEACVVDAVAHVQGIENDDVIHCTRCGLPSNYPGASMDEAGLCLFCRRFDGYRARVQGYFRTMDDLHALFARARSSSRSDYDCLMLLSGGKDSTYALYRLAGMGLRVLAFTLDNGYLSEQAKANIRRVTESLGVDHVFGTTPAMDAIFVDSLERHSNVCNGCFKTIYTLGMGLAKERAIPFIVTGLSRGQFFETRLTESLFTGDGFDADAIDDVILQARKAYHRIDDAVARLLDVQALQDDAIFEQVHFIDFYRYCDVSLDEMLRFLEEHAPWIRPEDTGRSTNCLINEAGIYVHQRARGYHNYAFPYSWDVRMGHKTREAALAELNDEIDPDRVRRLLSEIGYKTEEGRKGNAEQRLAAYYVSEKPLARSALREYLAEVLPSYMMPSHFIHVEALPLTVNGKVDYAALPKPGAERPDLTAAFVAPRTEVEQHLAGLWGEVLRVDGVGIYDNFFDLGGDSILAIQISARATEAGLVTITPNQLFQHQTVAELAAATGKGREAEAEQGLVTGPVPLTPIQRWFFEQKTPEPHHWNQSWLMHVTEPLEPRWLAEAVKALSHHHDALRLRFVSGDEGWTQYLAAPDGPVPLERIDLSAFSPAEQQQRIENLEHAAHRSLDLTEGPLWRMVYVERGPTCADALLVVVHHLAFDGLSWWILLEDLEAAYRRLARGAPIALPRKTTSFKRWAERLVAHAQTAAVRADVGLWGPGESLSGGLPEARVPDASAVGQTSTLVTLFTPDETAALLREATAAYRARHDEVLLAGLALALSQWADEPLRIVVEGHGRDSFADDLDVARTVGWFTSLFPLTLPTSKRSDPAEMVQAVKAQCRPALQNGLSYGLLRYFCEANDAWRRPAPLPDALLFNYMGPLDALLPTSTLFHPARPLALSRSPQMRRPFALEVNAFVDQDQLHVVWGYSAGSRSETTVQRMASAFASALRSMIEARHAADQATPSDFPLAHLDENQLGQVAALLRDADQVRR